MNATEKYYRKWIKEIAKRTNKAKIKKHLVHHMNELLDPSNEDYGNYLLWASSMYNLLEIFEIVYGIEVTPEFQLHRLLCSYEVNKKTRTPPPGNKIPKNVKIKTTYKR